MAASRVGAAAAVRNPDCVRWKEKTKKAVAAMAVTPAASPSSPSMKFMALIVTTVSRIVTGIERSEPRTKVSLSPQSSGT